MKVPHWLDSSLYALGTIAWTCLAFVGLCFWSMLVGFGGGDDELNREGEE